MGSPFQFIKQPDFQSSFNGIQRYDDPFTCFYQKDHKNAQERSEDSETTYVTYEKGENKWSGPMKI